MKIVVAGLALTLTILTSPVFAASISCGTLGKHPVCVALFAAYPPGPKWPADVMTGTAEVGGKTVRWTCRGAATPRDLRPCQY